MSEPLDSQRLATTEIPISPSSRSEVRRFSFPASSATSEELEKRVRQLTLLWELNRALLSSVQFERIAEITLTAITLGDGLGFNRAMLFLVNEKKGALEGTLAVGPDGAEEAGRIWKALSADSNKTLSEQLLRPEAPPANGSALSAMVKAIEIPLDRKECILSRTVHEGKPLRIYAPSPDQRTGAHHCDRGCPLGFEVACPLGQRLGQDPKIYSSATVPLWGKGKVIGVIMVDNLYNQNPITEEDLELLTLFSSQAGLALENAVLYRNLEEAHQEVRELQALVTHREKMAALGEFSNNLAHEIKNPLVAIGGFARRLYRTLPAEAPEKRYCQAIMVEVDRLERILGDIQNYTREDSPNFEPCDLQAILEESLLMAWEEIEGEGIEVVREYAKSLPSVRADYPLLKQAFFHLFQNARQAMNGKGTLWVRTACDEREGVSFVRVEIRDTGKGIAPQDLHNIFNPFFTTRESALGLGLPIVHKIVTSHGGQIEVDNRPGSGTTFIVILPGTGSRRL